MGLTAVFKVCTKTEKEICGGVPAKDFTGLTANVFTKSNKKALGKIYILSNKPLINPDEKKYPQHQNWLVIANFGRRCIFALGSRVFI
jgi:hypothetical protein